ncbi:MAG: hypothetical protein II937_09835 [Bacteroidales bacterium]|nr:hypothetical protein [Bacteroidales bacterium]
MIYSGNNKIIDIYKGTTKINKIFKGDTLIYQRKLYDSKIEYLESTGTQWIDTGIVSQNNLVYDFYLQESFVNNQKCFFGFKEKDQDGFDNWYSLGMNDANWGNNADGSYWVYVDFAGTEQRCTLSYPRRNGVYHFDFTDNNAYFSNNGTIYWRKYLSGTYYGTCHVFIFWYDGSFNYQDRKGVGRIYYFQVRKNGQLLFDGIPVRVGSVGYMYDRVSGKLFGNAGTGNFILGQDIN